MSGYTGLTYAWGPGIISYFIAKLSKPMDLVKGVDLDASRGSFRLSPRLLFRPGVA